MQYDGLLVYHAEFGPARSMGSVGSECTIELFSSPWSRKSVVVRASTLKRLYLQEQTRVHLRRGTRWRVARVLVGHRTADGSYEYELQLPNRVRETLSERDLFVRCWLPADDPTEVLAGGGAETQFFYERRAKISQVLIDHRAACRGLAGLLSARVELIPHQIDVARRVLEDPLQRYLLADEVGMGKTIEAGFVIRQFLLSEQVGNVKVVVPRPLVEQWRRELQEKFIADQFAERIVVLAHSDVPETSGPGSAGLLVIDEAHHLVGERIPIWLRSSSQECERLLLLSATPSLRDPSVLLRLLQILDPLSYGQVSLTEFESRLARQSEIGVFVRGLRADASMAVVRQRLRRIPELFPNDDFVRVCGESIAKSLEAQNTSAFDDHVARLRSHIADVYRIHHRLIRSRRRDCPDWVFRPRGRQPTQDGGADGSHLRSTWWEDSRLASCFELLEEWRVEAASADHRDPAIRRSMRDLYCRLFEAFNSGLPTLASALQDAAPSLPVRIREEFDRALRTGAEDDTPRAAMIASDLKRQVQSLQRVKPGLRPKLVVFGSSDSDLDACAAALKQAFDIRVVMDARSFGHADNIGRAFQAEPDAFFLLCNSEYEEGMNLHFADALIHLDLPLSPQRIEQRIGRLDRFGRLHESVEQRMVFPSVDEDRSPWEAWYELLAQGFQVFNTSIADVHFALNGLVESAKDALFEQGASGLRSLLPTVREHLRAERRALDDQYALDRVLQGEQEAHSFFDKLEDTDANEDSIADATHDWLSNALQLERQRRGSDAVIYRWDAAHTQLPAMPWKDFFAPALGQPYTASRQVACTPRGAAQAQLLRLGSPLLDIVRRHLRWDDRGVAFATWRVVEGDAFSEALVFRLCYVVEARLPDGLHGPEVAGWRARMDGLMPPWRDMIHVDSELRPVLDQGTLAVLQGQYAAWDNQGSDYNLSSRPEALGAVIDSAQFDALCRAAREQSELILRDSPTFSSRARQALSHGNAVLAQRVRRLQQRLALAEDAALRSQIAREIELHEKAQLLLQDPSIRLDAIGAFVLSSHPPRELQP